MVHLDRGVGDLAELVESLLTRRRPRAVDVLGNGGGVALDGVTLLIVGERVSDGTPLTEAVRRLREAHPETAIYLVARSSQRITRRLDVFARAGVDQAFELDIAADRDAFAEAVRRRLAAPPPVASLRELARRVVGMRIAPVALWCLRNGHKRATVEAVATRFGWDRKTLYTWSLEDLGVTIGGLIMRGVREHAYVLLGWGLSYAPVAGRLRYASASGVAKLIGNGRGGGSG